MPENRLTTALTPELYITDIQQSLRFYVDVLGFSIQYQREEDGFAMLERQGSRIMLEQIKAGSRKVSFTETGRTWLTAPMDQPFGRGINLKIKTTDVLRLFERTAASGATIFLPIEEKWYRANDVLLGHKQFIVQDPDGYLLRFFESLGDRKVAAHV